MDDDLDPLEDYFSKQVKPLSKKYQNIHQTKQSKRLKRPAKQIMDESEQDYLPLNHYQLEDVSLGANDLLSYQQTPMNHRHWKQFRLGNIPLMKHWIYMAIYEKCMGGCTKL